MVELRDGVDKGEGVDRDEEEVEEEEGMLGWMVGRRRRKRMKREMKKVMLRLRTIWRRKLKEWTKIGTKTKPPSSTANAPLIPKGGSNDSSMTMRKSGSYGGSVGCMVSLRFQPGQGRVFPMTTISTKHPKAAMDTETTLEQKTQLEDSRPRL